LRRASEKIESLQLQNKVLKLELETKKIMEVELEAYKMKTKLLQRQCNTGKISYNSTSKDTIPCENCMNIKDQLSSAQEELDSVKLINKLLQEDLELLRANLEELNCKCTNNGNNNINMFKWLEVSNEVRKSDPKIIYHAFEHIPVIINQKTKSGLRNGCKID
jgi:hypothetical protein